MRFVFIGLAIVLLSLLPACSEFALTESPQATEAQEHSESEQEYRRQAQPEQTHQEQPAESTEQTTETESEPSAQLVENLKSILFAETGVASDEVLSVSSEAVDWPDACLGIANTDELCAQVVTPGYRVVLHTLDRHYEFHTDRSGKNIKMVMF